ncbi:MAG: bifunctional diaminohydroxyphosphoribosylaminopyrimidine deaminase/5-amino-6-(5-phosphoribosylamino)uracil reductase RibD [Bacteroidales bacterium]|nr:bifunctional diaminohydroxyphosphoribosylaminopyrimidine deaminase/5-amino-6-(5-phosphoribosylamino)uracil reductase RibD [Bacteroidales bacterium]
MTDTRKKQLEFDRKMMRNSLRLAKKGCGFVAPNPLVGATIVKNGHIIGEGWHQKYGEAHAEIDAIAKSTSSVEGATLYVNLEPCAHQGKTPACSLAIIQNKFKRVVIACLDPNPLVSGKGVNMLLQAGIEVDSGILEQEAFKLNERFFKYITHNKPFIALKMASSLDGKIATFSGDSKWISNEKSRAFAHLLRLQYSAILVGINTVLTDDPQLNVRLKNKKIKNPLRIVLDSQLQIPLEAKILNASLAPTWIATTQKQASDKSRILEHKGIRVLFCPEKEGKIDLHYLIEKLADENIDSLLVEGGGTVNFSFAQKKLVDKVYAFIAPKLIGGAHAKTSMEGVGFEKLSDSLQLKNLRYKKLENNLLIEAYT